MNSFNWDDWMNPAPRSSEYVKALEAAVDAARDVDVELAFCLRGELNSAMAQERRAKWRAALEEVEKAKPDA